MCQFPPGPELQGVDAGKRGAQDEEEEAEGGGAGGGGGGTHVNSVLSARSGKQKDMRIVVN